MLAGERPNLEQAGLRGLLRVIGAEHPQLQPDPDRRRRRHRRQPRGRGSCCSGPQEDETAFRNAEWYTAHLYPSPLRPEERHTTVVDHEREGMRLEIRTPGDLQTLELTAFERVAPGPGQIEVAVTASSLNFADVLVAMGRYPSFDGNAATRHRLRRRRHRGRTRRAPPTRSVTTSAACRPTAAGAPS